MPNIEIHGLDSERADFVKKRIFALLGKKPYADEIVVTVFSTVVENIKGDSQPFLRLVNTTGNHNYDLLKELKNLEMDIEFMQLKSFYPK